MIINFMITNYLLLVAIIDYCCFIIVQFLNLVDDDNVNVVNDDNTVK